jgi:hypothetical protein
MVSVCHSRLSMPKRGLHILQVLLLNYHATAHHDAGFSVSWLHWDICILVGDAVSIPHCDDQSFGAHLAAGASRLLPI